ncbi:CapA family protein [Streptomyces sp. SYSU K217416]
MRGDLVTLALCGDVMLGRGVDQILPHPGDPELRERYLVDARAYVELAEAANGPVPHPVDYFWPWGDALQALEEAAPDAFVVNLETSITRSDDFAPGKEVHYRMDPANLPCLTAGRPDACVLANNHVLDLGPRGLTDTLDTLSGGGLRTAGAGRDAAEAWRPAAVTVDGGGRVLVFSCGMPSSGIPLSWAATDDRAGVAFVPQASDAAAAAIVHHVQQAKRPADVAVVSVHWGSNWGYGIPHDQIRFAHALIDGGVDVVHGHSSHHPRPVEVYRDKLILYGCGDFIDDYEGITGYEEYRDDLRLLYFAALEPDTGTLAEVRLAPLRSRRLRLQHAQSADRAWLEATLNRVSRSFGTHVARTPDGMLTLAR